MQIRFKAREMCENTFHAGFCGFLARRAKIPLRKTIRNSPKKGKLSQTKAIFIIYEFYRNCRKQAILPQI